MCKCLSDASPKSAWLPRQWPNRLLRLPSSSQAFLTFLIEQEIHYPSVKPPQRPQCVERPADNVDWGVLSALLIQSSPSGAAKQLIISACQVQA